MKYVNASERLTVGDIKIYQNLKAIEAPNNFVVKEYCQT